MSGDHYCYCCCVVAHTHTYYSILFLYRYPPILNIAVLKHSYYSTPTNYTIHSLYGPPPHLLLFPIQHSMCESMPNELREEHGGGTAQLSIYSLRDMTKVKTLSFPCGADFICSTFCSDPKMIAALSGDMDRQIVIWQWDKDKVSPILLTHPINTP